MNSSLNFQKLLFYHGTYELIYIFLMLLGQIHRVQTFNANFETYIYSACLFLWIPIEYFRLRFGYKGNINETFPELIAFQIFTVFFTLPLGILPMTQSVFLPHERICCVINLAFVFFQFVFCAMLIQNFIKT